MTDPKRERTAVLVVRAWTGPDSATLRARVTRTLDVAADQGVTSVLTSVEEVIAEVKDWLQAFLWDSPD